MTLTAAWRCLLRAFPRAVPTPPATSAPRVLSYACVADIRIPTSPWRRRLRASSHAPSALTCGVGPSALTCARAIPKTNSTRCKKLALDLYWITSYIVAGHETQRTRRLIPVQAACSFRAGWVRRLCTAVRDKDRAMETYYNPDDLGQFSADGVGRALPSCGICTHGLLRQGSSPKVR